jgi:hypothetical protein
MNKYQVWEGEMEVQNLDSGDVTLVTVIFSAMIGVILFITLLCKTGLAAIFKANGKKRKHYRYAALATNRS